MQEKYNVLATSKTKNIFLMRKQHILYTFELIIFYRIRVKKSNILSSEHNFSINIGQDIWNYTENKNNKKIS